MKAHGNNAVAVDDIMWCYCWDADTVNIGEASSVALLSFGL